MKLKLDENLGRRGADSLRAAGHDVATVAEQRLSGAKDTQLLGVCTGEGRALVTLDVDFANPIRFPPSNHAGVAVLRLASPAAFADIEAAVATLVDALSRAELHGALWIVQVGRVRVYTP